MLIRFPACLFLAVVSMLNTACSSSPSASIHQANINHIVLVSLQNDADSGELIHDCNTMLMPIPVVRSYWVGSPLKIGRGDSIDGNYSVGLCVGFDDVAGYRAYLGHPEHIALVEKWKTRWASIRLFDVICDP